MENTNDLPHKRAKSDCQTRVTQAKTAYLNTTALDQEPRPHRVPIPFAVGARNYTLKLLKAVS